jgi:hypothetical protein
MPTRILRDWTDSDRVDQLSADAERFFVRLIMKADDYGRYHGDSKRLKAFLFPLKPTMRETDIPLLIAECEKAGLLRCYDSGERRYLEIRIFNQRLRQMKHVFPEPVEHWPSIDRNPPSIDRRLRSDDSDPPPDRISISIGGEGKAHTPANSELPSREAAIAVTATSAILPDFASYVYDDWAGRGGKDAAGVERYWLQYVKTRWEREKVEWSNGTHKGRKGTNAKPTDKELLRNAVGG